MPGLFQDFSHLGRLNLPSELLGQTLSYLLPHDLAQFATTCQAAQRFVEEDNQALWRQAFLNVFDPPRTYPLSEEIIAQFDPTFNWSKELKSRLVARNLVLAQDKEDMESELYPKAIQAILEVVDTTFVPNASTKDQCLKSRLQRSRNLQWLESIFGYGKDTQKFVHDFTPASYASQWSVLPEETQGLPLRRLTRSVARAQRSTPSSAASRLHILHGLTERERGSKIARGQARQLVYDWSLALEDRDFGPFTAHGSADWRVLEAIYSVVIRNFEVTCMVDSDRPYVPSSRRNRIPQLIVPQGFRNSIPNLVPINPSIPRDWARVTGNWLGTYCFLDYSDLFFFNAGFQPNQRPSLDDYEEACGDLMRLDLALVESEEGDENNPDPIFQDPRLQSKLPYDDRLPILFFRGTSQGANSPSGHSPLISVRGRVNLMPGGREVRWRFIINYAGGDQWQLECVQPGGPGSGGVFGLWTHVDHEPGGPVGPVCYFPEELCKMKRHADGEYYPRHDAEGVCSNCGARIDEPAEEDRSLITTQEALDTIGQPEPSETS